VEYNARDLILYSLGIGSSDPRYVYELHDDFAAFPTYPIVLGFKGDSFNTLSFPSPAMEQFPFPRLRGVTVGLDAEKLIEKVNELPKDGAKLKLVGSIAGIHKKGKGALLEKEWELVDEAGKVYYKVIEGSFLVGAKDFTDSGRTFSKSIAAPSSPPTQTVETTTHEHIASIYRLSGDYNPLHVDPQFAKRSGFDKPIMHGQCTMGHATRAVLDAVAGGDHRRFKSVQIRFAAPVFPGQTLVTEIWQTSKTEVIFQTKVKETGKVCCSNGRMMLNPPASL
jgi:peroxisomal enoyl-CoA hydratase 2